MIKQRFIIDYSFDATRKIARKFVVRGRGTHADIIYDSLKRIWEYDKDTEVIQKKK